MIVFDIPAVIILLAGALILWGLDLIFHFMKSPYEWLVIASVMFAVSGVGQLGGIPGTLFFIPIWIICIFILLHQGLWLMGWKITFATLAQMSWGYLFLTILGVVAGLFVLLIIMGAWFQARDRKRALATYPELEACFMVEDWKAFWEKLPLAFYSYKHDEENMHHHNLKVMDWLLKALERQGADPEAFALVEAYTAHVEEALAQGECQEGFYEATEEVEKLIKNEGYIPEEEEEAEG